MECMWQVQAANVNMTTSELDKAANHARATGRGSAAAEGVIRFWFQAAANDK